MEICDSFRRLTMPAKTLLEGEVSPITILMLSPMCPGFEPLTYILASQQQSPPNSVQREICDENLPEFESSHNIIFSFLASARTSPTYRGKDSQSQFRPASGYV